MPVFRPKSRRLLRSRTATRTWHAAKDVGSDPAPSGGPRGLRRLVRATLALAAAAAATAAVGQAGTIEEIRFQGLFQMQEPAAIFALGISVGDPYDEAVIRRQFRALWERNLFDDITIEADDTPTGGKILFVKVKEKPKLTAIEYSENRVLNRTQIEDRLREREVMPRIGTPVDMGVISDAAAAIRDYLGEKGFLDSRVETTIQDVTTTTRAVRFDVVAGRKTRIRSIAFDGNTVYSDRKLRGALKLTAGRSWYWPWSSKNLYHPLKWDQDVQNIRDLYQNLGYLDIDLRPPVLEFRATKGEDGAEGDAEDDEAAAEPTGKQGKKAAKRARKKARAAKKRDVYDEFWDEASLEGLPPKKAERRQRKLEARREKHEERIAKLERKERERDAPRGKRWVDLIVPVREGEQYKTGDVTIEGNTVFETDELRRLVLLKEGAVLRNNLLDLGVRTITRRYEDRGHLYATVVRQIRRRPDEAIADIVVSVDEDDPYYVERVEFDGNTATHDRVMRREVLLNEQTLFNRTRLDLSRQKINQLGYVEAPDDPAIEPIPGENRVRIRFPVQEKGRNEIQVGGGYSGLDGAFFSGVYSTRNFLGRGQVLSTALQIGGRSNRYSLSFSEPWFLGRPITLGGQVFRQDVDFGGTLESSSKGFGAVIGRRLTTFSDFQVGYRFESVESTAVGFASINPDGTFNTVRNVAENDISSLTPVYSYNRVNNPFRPTAGQSFVMSFQVAGGPLGGDTQYLRPVAQYTKYTPTIGRAIFAFHGELGLVSEWQGGTENNSATVEGVPRFQRFWLGGDTQGPRVFDTRTITPRRYVELDGSGNIARVLGDPRTFPVADFVANGGVPVLVEVGGDRYFLFQSELVYPLNAQADFALFLDVGDSLFEDQSLGFDTARVSAGLELRLNLPVFPVPLRLIYGFPIREDPLDDTSSFQFSIGRSF